VVLSHLNPHKSSEEERKVQESSARSSCSRIIVNEEPPLKNPNTTAETMTKGNKEEPKRNKVELGRVYWML
jgi:hypothetical protein